MYIQRGMRKKNCCTQMCNKKALKRIYVNIREKESVWDIGCIRFYTEK